MNYEDFKKNYCEALNNNFSDWELKKYPIINEVKDAVKIEKTLFFIEDAYNYYEVCNDFQIVIERLKESLVEAKKIVPVDLEINKENIVMQLINKQINKELLKDIPYRDYLDLAIIYREVNKNFTSLITNNDLEKLALDEDELFLIAKENTQRIFPTMILRADIPLFNLNDGVLYSITNSENYYGAVNILFNDIIEIAGNYNLYILPMSLHDMGILKADNISPEILLSCHKMIQDETPIEEFLSENIYFYNKETKEISVIKPLDEKEKIIMRKTAALINKFKGEGIL